MKKNNVVRMKPIAAAIAACWAMGGTTVYAQEGNAPVEEVLVTGIRAALERAVDVKREATGVVDAISAEDIGKFPDTNLAESLQRIPGVSIDRSNGEGSKVTVRGFGADRNLITLNGRIMPTTTGDRTFEFANIASESVSAVEVYKTSDATVTSGGIGATVNLKTHKPLDNVGMKATIGGKMVIDDSAEDGGVTPELSGLYSNTFMDDRLGVSISASYQERESGLKEFLQDQGYRGQDNSYTGWGGAPAAPDGGVNRPATDTGGIYSVPQQPRYIFEERQRERINGQLVLQYEPVDDVRLTLDYTMVENTYETQHFDVSAWFNYSDDRDDSVWAGDPDENSWPLVYSEIYPASDRDTSLTVGDYGAKEEMDSIGFNVEWQTTDQLTLEFDVHTSDGKLSAVDPRKGTRNNLQLPSYTRGQSAMDLTGDLPGIGIGTSDLANFTPATLQLSGSWFQNHLYEAEVDQVQFKGKFEFTDEMSIDFGLSHDTVSNHFQFVSVERPDWGGVGAPGDFAGINWTEDSVLDAFQDAPGNFGAITNQTGGEKYALLDRIWFADFDQIVAAAEAADTTFNTTSNIHGDCAAPSYGVGTEGAGAGYGQFCASSNFGLGRSEFTEEETLSAFVKFNMEGELNGYPYDLHVGIRQEQTDIYSSAAVPSYAGVAWTEATQAALQGDGTFLIYDKEGDYSVFLPSLNFNISPSDDFKIRTAIGKTISRAAYTDLLGGINTDRAGTRPTAQNTGWSGSTGNPNLVPLESINIDLSVEWYYDDTSYASLGAFRKSVKNWTSTVNDRMQVYADPLPNVFDGPLFQDAIDNLPDGASNEAIRDYIFANHANDPSVDVANQTIYGNTDTDGGIMFDIRSPVNSDDKRTVSGLEFNIQHMFGDSGFGGVLNYTIVDSDIAYDNTVVADTPALTGLSDTANLVFFYDNYGVQARLAYNWRDEFLNERRVSGDLTAGIYTEEYSQIDMNVSYDLPMVDGLTVFFEGINLTDEYVKTHGRVDALVYRVTETGPRFNLGARYTF